MPEELCITIAQSNLRPKADGTRREENDAMGSGNLVALTESTQVFCFLYYTMANTDWKSGLSILACQIVMTFTQN